MTNLYSVYECPEKYDDGPLFIKQGYNIIAGIFNLLWALYHRMWQLAIIILIINIAIRYVIDEGISGEYMLFTRISIFLLLTIFASDLREYYISKKGYVLKDVILANSEEQAEASYVMRSNQR